MEALMSNWLTGRSIPTVHQGCSSSTMNASRHSGRWPHTRRITMEHGGTQENCEARSAAHRMDMRTTILLHKTTSREEHFYTEGWVSISSNSTVLHRITMNWCMEKRIMAGWRWVVGLRQNDDDFGHFFLEPELAFWLRWSRSFYVESLSKHGAKI